MNGIIKVVLPIIPFAVAAAGIYYIVYTNYLNRKVCSDDPKGGHLPSFGKVLIFIIVISAIAGWWRYNVLRPVPLIPAGEVTFHGEGEFVFGSGEKSSLADEEMRVLSDKWELNAFLDRVAAISGGETDDIREARERFAGFDFDHDTLVAWVRLGGKSRKTRILPDAEKSWSGTLEIFTIEERELLAEGTDQIKFYIVEDCTVESFFNVYDYADDDGK